ncbi:MAG: phosphate ABC transporter substrate-binding protein [Victivallales bacterium]|nr:phosphate ABC transporter substrate-binding protein [Victivallales bacterium]
MTKRQIIGGIAAGIVAFSANAQDKIVIDGSTTVGPIAKAFAEYYMSKNPKVNITVSESGSGNGAKSLINKTCQIGAMSRAMKDNEFKAAVENGVSPTAHVIALDGLPVIVHPSNPVKGLKIEQVRDIYTGKIKNWKEVGGPDMNIVVVSRDTNSGTYETFESLVMKKDKIRSDAEHVGSNGAVRQRIQTTTGAIGYAGLGFVDKTVKALEMNGIYPTVTTVQSGQYPISRALYMYTDRYPGLGTPLYQFVTIHLTRNGQEMVEEIGFVPVTAYKLD